MKKDNKGKWSEIVSAEYRNVVNWLLNDNETGCDPMRKNNAGKTPRVIADDLIKDKKGRSEEECKVLDDILKKLKRFIVKEKITRKVKAGAALSGGWYVASYVAVPLVAWNWTFWICNLPVRALKAAGAGGILSRVGLDGVIGSYFLTFCVMSGILYFFKKKIKRVLGCSE